MWEFVICFYFLPLFSDREQSVWFIYHDEPVVRNEWGSSSARENTH